MNIIQMEYLIAVIEEKTLTAAAEKLHVTQPALTRSIRRIEESIGCPLFEHSGRNIIPNKNAQILYKWAKKSLTGYHQALAQINEEKNEDENTLTVALSGFVYAMPIIVNFQVMHPEIHMNNFKFFAEDFPDIVYRDSVDCLLSVKDYKAADIDSFLYSRGPLYVAMPAVHPLAGSEGLYLEQIRNEPLIMSSGNTLYIETIHEMFGQIGAVPNIRTRVESSHLAHILANGLGISIINVETIETIRNDQGKCVFIPLLDEFCHTDVYFITRRSSRRSQGKKLFIKYLKDTSSFTS